MPHLLAMAFVLLLLDWLIMLVMAASWPVLKRVAAPVIIVMLSMASPATAQDGSRDIEYAAGLHLAYIRGSDQSINRTAQAGLEALKEVLKERTSVEPEGVVALDPEKDSLAFFPLIYWPIGTRPDNLSDTALRNIQHYLDHGGTILFDTRDQRYAVNSTSGFATTQNEAALRQTTNALNIPPLAPISDDHVLGKSFYLLQSFPGRYDGGTLWVEEQSAQGRDGVSSVIIGGHDWAAAWGAVQNGGSLRPRLSGGPHQQEMALRFGVNLVMYALTGNYKDDQVHLPHILERLGQ